MSLSDFKLLSFDVYGTLIDWEMGVLSALEPLLRANHVATSSQSSGTFSRHNLLTVYHELEAHQQSLTPDLPYSSLMTLIHPLIADRLSLSVKPTPEQSQAFGASVGNWPAFPDTVDALTRLRTAGYKLVVLSNVDRESFALTNSGPLRGFQFDAVITAQDVGSYKPDLKNFEFMLQRVKEEFGVEKNQVLQTAQSQFHDHQPAKKMDVKSVWVVRPGAVMGNRPAEEGEIWDWRFDTLGDMADLVEKGDEEK